MKIILSIFAATLLVATVPPAAGHESSNADNETGCGDGLALIILRNDMCNSEDPPACILVWASNNCNETD